MPCVADGVYLCFICTLTRNAKCSSVSHTAAAASIVSSVECFQICPGDRVIILSSTTCVASILESFATLATGATLCIASEGEVLADLAHTLMLLRVSHVFATPTLISLLGGPAQVPYLRFHYLEGEPATANLLRLWCFNSAIVDGFRFGFMISFAALVDRVVCVLLSLDLPCLFPLYGLNTPSVDFGYEVYRP